MTSSLTATELLAAKLNSSQTFEAGYVMAVFIIVNLRTIKEVDVDSAE